MVRVDLDDLSFDEIRELYEHLKPRPGRPCMGLRLGVLNEVRTHVKAGDSKRAACLRVAQHELRGASDGEIRRYAQRLRMLITRNYGWD